MDWVGMDVSCERTDLIGLGLENVTIKRYPTLSWMS